MEKVRLLDVCDVYQPQTIATKLFVPDGKYSVYGANGEIGRYDKYNHEEPEVLMACRGATCGTINVSKPYSWINGNAMVIHPNGKVDLNKDYLKYYLVSVNKDSIISGTAQPQITRQNLKDFKIIICDIDTQKQIVQQIEEQLSQLDSAVETLKKTKQQLEVYRQAVLKDAFEGKLSKNRKVDSSLPFIEEAEAKKLPTIPKEWKYVKLSFLGELARGKSKHRPRNDKKLFENGKYPFIQTGDVKNANKYITSYTAMYGEYGLQQSKLWKADTLCITIAANIAETAFLGIDACFPDSIVGFLPSENVFAEYVRFFIDSQKVRLWAYAPATAQKNINLKTLENLVVPYCSLEEQQEIVRIIEEKMTICNSIENTINQSLQQAEALRQSILKQAFEG